MITPVALSAITLASLAWPLDVVVELGVYVLVVGDLRRWVFMLILCSSLMIFSGGEEDGVTLGWIGRVGLREESDVEVSEATRVTDGL